MRLICKWKKFYLAIIHCCFLTCANSQDYRAVHGSSYGGSLVVANNPASIVHIPFVLDLTPLAFQFKHSTNAFVIKNSSYLSSKNAEIFLSNGKYKSFIMANQDIRLLNASIRIGDRSAIAFGAAGRSYISANTSSLLFQDSVGRIREFMGNNISNIPASAEARGHAWAEIFGTFARTIFDNSNAILNAGITVKTNLGIAGGYLTATDLNETAGTVNNKPGYYLTSGLLNYGFSSNIDVLDSSTSYNTAKKDFFRNTFSTFGISAGVEYIVPANIEGNGYEHELKIGLSLLDLGANRFQYSGYSRAAILNKNNVSDSLLDVFFDNISDAASLADSLYIISGSNSPLAGNYKIFQPARIVVNADKHLSGNIFINGELTIPFHTLMGNKQLVARDMNFINLTARFETPYWGIYFPASLNNRMHFWLGGAFRFGPLLLGVHNWASVLGKNKIQDGGAYLAFTFRFGEKNRIGGEKGQLNSGKALKQLKCPPSVL
ncbi:MAG TPA: hypothetical protein VI548_09760 [Chitinophagaceae bacterium]|nr:hypothetical protein [Chitinophagaceae bacterium]